METAEVCKLKIDKNDFLKNGFVRYADEYGNEVTCQKTQEGFEVRPKFANRNIRAYGIKVPLPLDENQDKVRMDYSVKSPDVDMNSEDVKAMFQHIADLVEHWASMLTDVRFFYGADNNMLLRANPEVTNEDVWAYKFSLLCEYEELSDIIKSFESEDKS